MDGIAFRHVAMALTTVAAVSLGWDAKAGDPAAGKTQFQRQCASCHIDTAEGARRLGPTLFGIVGRKTGAVEGFRYTEANRNAGWVWTTEKLDEYLKNPRASIPGTNMAFAGVRSDKDRADLVAYLATLK
ncbi:MAG: c-type cytochrome [Rhodospirillales bacterium]|jgi:cytochrome c